MRHTDPPTIAAAFAALGWPGKTIGHYERYLTEQTKGERSALVAECDGEFAGYVTVRWESDYEPFRAAGIPEISDLNVLPPLRRRGIATALLDRAEGLIAARSAIAGIGVGLYEDYGPAQRLYVRRGYVPDGRGIVYDWQAVEPGAMIRLDDDAVLMLTRDLHRAGSARGTSGDVR